MKIKKIIVLSLMGLSIIPLKGQEVNLETEVKLNTQFTAAWMYFRMQNNPLLAYEETHDGQGNWINPFKPYHSFFDINMVHDLKISRWDKFSGSYQDLDGKRHNYIYGHPSFLFGRKREWTIGFKKGAIYREYIGFYTIKYI